LKHVETISFVQVFASLLLHEKFIVQHCCCLNSTHVGLRGPPFGAYPKMAQVMMSLTHGTAVGLPGRVPVDLRPSHAPAATRATRRSEDRD